MISAWIPTCVSLLLALANVGFAGAGGPRVVKPGDQIDVALGFLDVGSDHTVLVHIQNGTTEVWDMPQVDVSCPACMTIVSAPLQLDPGEVGQFEVQVHAVGDPGMHRWGVSLHGGGSLPLGIDVSGVLRGLRVEPPRAAFGRLVRGDAGGIDVRVSWFGEEALESVHARSTSADVKATVQAARVGKSINVTVLLACTSQPRIVSASVQVSATIRGPDGLAHVVRRAIPVAGHVVDPSLTVRPAAAFLGSMHAGQGAHMLLRVSGMEASRVEARAAMPGLRVSVQNNLVELQYAPSDGVVGLAQGVVELGWGDPWATRAQIPVTVYVQMEQPE
jgi:hypothetical protein